MLWLQDSQPFWTPRFCKLALNSLNFQTIRELGGVHPIAMDTFRLAVPRITLVHRGGPVGI